MVPKDDDGWDDLELEPVPERVFRRGDVHPGEPERRVIERGEFGRESPTEGAPVGEEGDRPPTVPSQLGLPKVVGLESIHPFSRSVGVRGHLPTHGTAPARYLCPKVARGVPLGIPRGLVPHRIGPTEAMVVSWRVPTEARSEKVFPVSIRGRVDQHRFPSRVLEGNPWGDPVERDLPVYVPPSGESEGRPLLVLLSGYTGAGWLHFQRPRFLHDTIVGRLDRLIRNGLAAEAVLVAPDCLTTLGGSQYLNSSATGRYEDYVMTEVIPWVQEKYRTGPVGVMGTSSGGYGSLVLALRHPEVFRAAASNAGDAYFEYCYLPEFPVAFRQLRKAGGPVALLRRLLSEPLSNFGPRNPQMQAFEMMGYASCYTPIDSEPGRFDLPFDLDSGAVRDDVWSRWLAWDPIRMIRTDRYREALRRLAYVYVDGGTQDEYGLDIGARVFAATAAHEGIPIDLEEFDGVHFDGGPRYDVMIPRLVRALGFPAPKGLPVGVK